MNRVPGSELAEEFYNHWDANNDGTLSKKEIKNHMLTCGFYYGDWKDLWYRYDANDSGTFNM
jgi:hypothetical protein